MKKTCPHDPSYAEGFAEARSGDPVFLPDDYEERLAIAEYNGRQTSVQAQRTAYRDAFISVLNTLPYEGTNENYTKLN